MNKAGIKYLVEPMGIEPTTSRVRFPLRGFLKSRYFRGNGRYIKRLHLVCLCPRFLSFPLFYTTQVAPEVASDLGGGRSARSPWSLKRMLASPRRFFFASYGVPSLKFFLGFPGLDSIDQPFFYSDFQRLKNLPKYPSEM